MIVGVLLQKGVDVNAHEGEYSSALEVASRNVYEAVVALLNIRRSKNE